MTQRVQYIVLRVVTTKKSVASIFRIEDGDISFCRNDHKFLPYSLFIPEEILLQLHVFNLLDVRLLSTIYFTVEANARDNRTLCFVVKMYFFA